MSDLDSKRNDYLPAADTSTAYAGDPSSGVGRAQETTAAEGSGGSDKEATFGAFLQKKKGTCLLLFSIFRCFTAADGAAGR